MYEYVSHSQYFVFPISLMDIGLYYTTLQKTLLSTVTNIASNAYNPYNVRLVGIISAPWSFEQTKDETKVRKMGGGVIIPTLGLELCRHCVRVSVKVRVREGGIRVRLQTTIFAVFYAGELYYYHWLYTR